MKNQPDCGPTIRPPSYPWRADLARWTIEGRLAWGLRANELEEQGVKFPESEKQAYLDVAGEVTR